MAYIHHLSVSKSSPEMSGPCVFCQQEYIIKFASQEQIHECLTAYLIHEKLIQEAFPQHSTEDREFMISGVCPTCWNETFDKEDDDELNLLEETVHIIDEEIEEVDDFADIDDFEEDDFFLPTEFPPNED